MTKKIRLIRTMIVEYEPQPEFYETDSIEEMAQIDSKTEDIDMLFDFLEEDTISWEVIEDDGETVRVISREGE